MSTPFVSKGWETWRASRWFRLLASSIYPRVALGVIALIAVLWGVAAVLVPRLVDLNVGAYRTQILAQIERQVGRPVELGRLSLRLWPRVTVRAEEVVIAEDPTFATGRFVSARTVELQVGLRSLLRGRPQLTGLALQQPAVVLIKEVRDQQPVWNWSTLQPFREPKTQESLPPFDLAVEEGRFTLIDRSVAPATETVYDKISVDLEGFSPRQSFDFSLGLTMPGENGGRAEVQGTAGPIELQDLTQTPIEATLELQEVEVSALEALVGVSSPRRGRVTFDLSLAGRLADSLRAQGTLFAEGVRLAAWGEPSRHPLEVTFNLTVAATPPVKGAAPASPFDVRLQIDEGEAALGKAKVRLRGGVKQLLDHPTLDLTLDGSGVALGSLLEAAPAFGFGPPAGTRIQGNADLSLKMTGKVPVPALDGKLVVRDLRFEMAGLPQAIEVGQLTLLANPTLLSVTPFQTSVGARSILEFDELTLADYQERPRFRMDASTQNAQLGDVLQIAESMGVRTQLKGSGQATLRAEIDANLTTEQPKWTIEGQGSLRQASLQPTGWTQPMQVAKADVRLTGDQARVEQLEAKIASTSLAGWLEVRQFDRPAVRFDLRGDQLILAEWQKLMGLPPAGRSAGVSGGAAENLTVDGRFALGRLQFDGISASGLQGQLAYRPQTLTLDPLALSLYGGGYQGALRLDLATTPLGMAVKGRLTNVDLQNFLVSLGQTRLIQGRLDTTFDLRGRGTEGPVLARSLAGTGQVEIRDGQLTSFDLLAQIERLGKLANLPTGGAGTAFRSLKSNLTFGEGQLRTDGLEIATQDLSVTGQGRLQLIEPLRMDYSVLAQLSPDLTRRILSSSNVTGGQGTVGRLLSSFFVERESLVIPLQVSGPLQQPTFGIDSAVLRRRARTNLLDNLRQRVLGGAVDAPGQPKEPSPSPEKREPGVKETLREILERIRKKPPEKP